MLCNAWIRVEMLLLFQPKESRHIQIQADICTLCFWCQMIKEEKSAVKKTEMRWVYLDLLTALWMIYWNLEFKFKYLMITKRNSLLTVWNPTIDLTIIYYIFNMHLLFAACSAFKQWPNNISTCFSRISILWSKSFNSENHFQIVNKLSRKRHAMQLYITSLQFLSIPLLTNSTSIKC